MYSFLCVFDFEKQYFTAVFTRGFENCISIWEEIKNEQFTYGPIMIDVWDRDLNSIWWEKQKIFENGKYQYIYPKE